MYSSKMKGVDSKNGLEQTSESAQTVSSPSLRVSREGPCFPGVRIGMLRATRRDITRECFALQKQCLFYKDSVVCAKSSSRNANAYTLTYKRITHTQTRIKTHFTQIHTQANICETYERGKRPRGKMQIQKERKEEEGVTLNLKNKKMKRLTSRGWNGKDERLKSIAFGRLGFLKRCRRRFDENSSFTKILSSET